MLEIILPLMCFFILAGVGIGWWIVDGIPKAKKQAMQEKFGSLGDVRGKTLKQIIAVVGSPTARASVGDGTTSYSWSTQKYHVTLLFNGDICEGVTSEIEV